jgi:hypothetical protein
MRGSGTALTQRKVLRPEDNNTENNTKAAKSKQDLFQALSLRNRRDENATRAWMRCSSVALSEIPKA